MLGVVAGGICAWFKAPLVVVVIVAAGTTAAPTVRSVVEPDLMGVESAVSRFQNREQVQINAAQV